MGYLWIKCIFFVFLFLLFIQIFWIFLCCPPWKCCYCCLFRIYNSEVLIFTTILWLVLWVTNVWVRRYCSLLISKVVDMFHFLSLSEIYESWCYSTYGIFSLDELAEMYYSWGVKWGQLGESEGEFRKDEQCRNTHEGFGFDRYSRKNQSCWNFWKN